MKQPGASPQTVAGLPRAASALVSVIMPVFNGEKYLAEAIESILSQTFTDFELIIVDDGSQDGSADIIRDYAQEDGRIRLLQHHENQGRADARNTGIADSHGSLIAMMDCDDISLPERLEKQVAFLENNPEIGGLGTQGMFIGTDSEYLQDIHKPVQHADIVWQHFFHNAFLQASIMLRREFLCAVGGYEPGRRFVDDQMLITSLLHNANIRFANLPEKLYGYRQHEQAKFLSPKANQHLIGITREIKKRSLERLWGTTASDETFDRIVRLRRFNSFTWRERRATKRDLQRLIAAMRSANWIDAHDESVLIDKMNQRLEKFSPRIWQQFCHWRRHRLGF